MNFLWTFGLYEGDTSYFKTGETHFVSKETLLPISIFFAELQTMKKNVVSLHPKVLKKIAQVAELVDAADSKSAVRKDVLVRFQSWAQN